MKEMNIKQVRKKTGNRNYDIVCPDCKGMLDDIIDSKHLYCPRCNTEWRV